MTKQVNVRLSSVSLAKLKVLTRLYDSQRVVIEVAINALFEREFSYDETLNDESKKVSVSNV